MKCLWLCDLPVLRFLCMEIETSPYKSSLEPLRWRRLWIFCESRLRRRPGGLVCWQSFMKVDSALLPSSVSWEDRAMARFWRAPGPFSDKPSPSGPVLALLAASPCPDSVCGQWQSVFRSHSESFILFLFEELSLLLSDKLGFHHTLPLTKCSLLWKRQIRSWLSLLLLHPCESGTVTFCIAYPELQKHGGFNSVLFPAPAPWPSTVLAQSVLNGYYLNEWMNECGKFLNSFGPHMYLQLFHCFRFYWREPLQPWRPVFPAQPTLPGLLLEKESHWQLLVFLSRTFKVSEVAYPLCHEKTPSTEHAPVVSARGPRFMAPPKGE